MDLAEGLRSDKRRHDMDESDPDPRVPRRQKGVRQSKEQHLPRGPRLPAILARLVFEQMPRPGEGGEELTVAPKHFVVTSPFARVVYKASVDVVANGARDMIHTNEEPVTNPDKVYVIFAPFASCGDLFSSPPWDTRLPPRRAAQVELHNLIPTNEEPVTNPDKHCFLLVKESDAESTVVQQPWRTSGKSKKPSGK